MITGLDSICGGDAAVTKQHDTMNDALPLTTLKPLREWEAKLALEFAQREKTVVLRAKHLGPLRIQRPFYPEGDCCHCYVLHPPGGMAPGDTLTLSAELPEGTQVLLTTPAAGKVYTSDQHGHPQYQGIHASVAANACLEWLPQETIVFSGAKAELQNHFHLRDNANLIAWDFVCLGRRASGEQFSHGDCIQLIEVTRDNRLVLRERTQWLGGSDALAAHWGMGGHVVSGTLIASVEASRQQIDDWRDGLSQRNFVGEWGMTQKPGFFVARFLGQSPEQGRRGFEYLWSQLRPLVNGREICRPRIWNT